MRSRRSRAIGCSRLRGQGEQVARALPRCLQEHRGAPSASSHELHVLLGAPDLFYRQHGGDGIQARMTSRGQGQLPPFSAWLVINIYGGIFSYIALAREPTPGHRADNSIALDRSRAADPRLARQRRRFSLASSLLVKSGPEAQSLLTQESLRL
jgi:hypothetical protein